MLVRPPVAAGLVALALAASTVLGLVAVAGQAAANGIGDLYAAAPLGVLELHVRSTDVVNTVELEPGPTALAFTPDGRTLYAAAERRRVTRIDIETISAAGTIDLPAVAAALAHPKGDELVLAFPALKTLGVLDASTETVIQSRELPSGPDLLAADRRDGRVVAGAAGRGWIALFDPGTGSLRSLALEGRVSALALSHADGMAYVATRSPNRVVAISLDDVEPAWSASLPEPPSAVARLEGRVVAATGKTLWRVGAAGVARWGDATAPVESLASSDEGRVLYAGERDRIEAFTASGVRARTLQLTGPQAPVALAAVPQESSIANLAGPAGSPLPGAPGTPQPATGTKPPPTDTVIEAAADWVASRHVLPEALMVGVAILVAGLLAIHWYERRGEPV